uniref:Putative lipoprotein n=1 Tax=Myxococcus virescens TaxID=83456 RepID=A0A7D5T1E9_9BACT|nr:putative lipoprotein [Myxococcus virescens]
MQMRVGIGCVLVGLGSLGCGGAGTEEVQAPQEESVQALACAPAGAVYKVKDILPPNAPLPSPGEPVPDWLTNVQGTLFFASNLYMDRSILWRSDGTSNGTVPVKEFPWAGLPSGAWMGDFRAVGSRLFFMVATPALGRELWVSDGTEVGTRLVRDFEPGSASASLSSFGQAGNALTFFRRAAVGSGLSLWRSDGTPSGTFQLRDFGAEGEVGPWSLGVAGAHLYILRSPGDGTWLWRTDGTVAGTTQVKRLDSGQVHITEWVHTEEGHGVFSFGDAGPITEVWKTDGTPGGTVRLDSFGGYVRLLGALGGHAYVASAVGEGPDLRLSRVSLAGGGKETVTTLPNRFGGQPDAWPYAQTAVRSGGKLYLSVGIGTPGPAPREVSLWVTDGTAAGTRELSRGLSTSDERSSPLYDTGAGTLVFSTNDGGTGLEPWVTDGTLDRTGLISDITPSGGSRPEAFTRVGGTLFFRAYSNTWGDALYAMPAAVTCPTQALQSR